MVKKNIANSEKNKKQGVLNALLAQAIYDEKFDHVERWISQGADIHAKSNQNMNYIQEAVEHLHFAEKNLSKEHINIFKYLIDEGLNINHTPWSEGNNTHVPLIHFAVEQGKVDLVRLLLDHGAKTGYKIKGNLTLLHLLVPFHSKTNDQDQCEIAKLLLKDKSLRAKIDFKEKEHGWTILHRATRFDKT